MKKHLFGLAIFGFIFTAFAFFYAPPTPQNAEIGNGIGGKQPIVVYGKTSCFRNSRKNLSVEVVNSQYFYDEDKIYAEVKLAWNGSGAPPKKVDLTTMLSLSEQTDVNSFGKFYLTLNDPFKDKSQQTLKLTLCSSCSEKIKKQDNLYVAVAVSEYSGDEMSDADKSFSERKEVVIVHGEISRIRR